MTKYPDLFAALAAPFEAHEVKQRQAPGGRQLSYITARTAMNRLDSVLGPECWWDEYVPLDNSVICKLTLRLPDGSTVTKCDAGGHAGMADQGDDEKSGFSDAFKRACSKFGVARYLYRDGFADFVREREPEASQAPQHQQQSPSPRRAPDDRPQQQGQKPQGAPRSGKALFAWAKEQQYKHGQEGLINAINAWAKGKDYPSRMVDWDEVQVEQGYHFAQHKIQKAQGGKFGGGRPDEDPKALREDLSRLLWRLAGSKNEDDFWAVLARLDGIQRDGHRPIIKDLQAEGNPSLLAEYIAVATDILSAKGDAA